VLIAIAALALLALALPTVADAAKRKKPTTVTVMTRNLYLGADLIPIAAAQSQSDLEQAVTNAWNNVVATDFAARAKRIAKEVQRQNPDVIALQEGARWRRGPKDPNTPATEVDYDYLPTLRRELKRLGLKYRLGKVQSEIEIEAPSNGTYDYRLTQQDAILIKKKKGLKVRKLDSGRFKARLDIPTLIGTVNVFRGWTAADLTLNKKRLRVVDTHLESYSEDIRTAQANELIANGGPARKKGALILAGDLNSDPSGAGNNGPGAYNAVTGFGFLDTWKRAHKGNPGLTYGHQGDLRNATAAFKARIDYIFARGIRKVLGSKIFGVKPSERTPSGLWPSDHAGLATKLQLK
jgi:endonuclease/exonuclease/phosphatase family metal-dependent hydrolase